MTQYYPGPWEVELFYTEGGITHKQRLNCDISAQGAVGDPFSAFTVTQKNNIGVTLNTAVDAWVNIIKPLFAATTNFTIANLYKYTPNSYDKAFFATYDVNQIGTGAGGAQLNQQLTLTFTTVLGNNVRVAFLDVNTNLSTRIPIRDATAQIQAVASFLVGSTGWIIARDGSFPAGRLNSSQGQNEALFKTRNR